jgi:NitT/TauT family transport system permease protein
VAGGADAAAAAHGTDSRATLLRRIYGKERVALIVPPTISFLVFLGIWQALSKSGTVDEIILPAPTDIADALVQIVQESFFWEATWVTAQEALIGFAAGVLIAWILGTLIGLFRTFSLMLYPPIVAFQIMPRVALAPVFIAWFGLGIASKIVMAATICFFPVLVNTILGLEGVSKDSRALMRSLGASRWEEYRKLLLPASLPAIFASLKVAIALALIGAIVAEFLGASEGMGVLLREFSFQLRIAEGFAVLVALSGLGLIFFLVAVLLESRLIFWRGR